MREWNNTSTSHASVTVTPAKIITYTYRKFLLECKNNMSGLFDVVVLFTLAISIL